MKKLVIITALLAFSLLVIGIWYHLSHPTTVFPVKKGNPILGSSKAQTNMILIEDLRCEFCHKFSLEIWPYIQKNYIDTEKAYCVFIPVDVLPESMALANAALAVYHQAPDRFLAYVHALFEQFAGPKDLLPIAARIGGIDLTLLGSCIATNCYAAQIEDNLIWAKQMMGAHFGVPALFINGVQVSTGSLDAIIKELQQ
jgi:protein-disulfide isomerase